MLKSRSRYSKGYQHRTTTAAVPHLTGIVAYTAWFFIIERNRTSNSLTVGQTLFKRALYILVTDVSHPPESRKFGNRMKYDLKS